MSAPKDLRRQLQSEAARAEQLAVQLAAASAELDQLSSPLDPALPEADRTSVSSSAWSLPSLPSQGQDRETSTPAPLSSSPEPHPASTPALVRDNETLLAKVAVLQEEKWLLEERLAMLEQSGAGMADEIVSKSRVIAQYCMQAGGRGAARASQQPRPGLAGKLDRLVRAGDRDQEVASMQVVFFL